MELVTVADRVTAGAVVVTAVAVDGGCVPKYVHDSWRLPMYRGFVDVM